MARDFLSPQPSALESLYLPRARQLYVEEGMEVRAIADRLAKEHRGGRKLTPPSRGTVERWKRKHGWKAERAAYNRTSLPVDAALQEARSLFLERLTQARESKDTKDVKNLSDALATLQKIYEQVGARRILEANIMLTLRGLTRYLEKHNPQLAQGLAPLVTDIYLYILDEYAPTARRDDD